ncbi:protein-L-isoaspartate(D-aspartate) O-methyltransferase [Carboxylicivirga sp. A043]|uniref:protein-L-isoaspartate(D-aspartate) O-methyltransferase n=1 Tax=Carboxylicivirga litoralis TaxID=2816963 RepID=UPI0021CB47C2|nr:protein-L-isoaspartate(D-aspartate) O-methyltransferase [Carboxylicivirga sp. A043]MCU4155720.1 protein-L-isoaspartate(D-aspartate) O-methyltransferase [Carboxylicivirga sp. A043]
MFGIILINILLCLTFQNYTDMRANMVENQIIKRGISNPATITAMQKVPRHLFVPDELQPFAYDDRPLPIGNNQTISQPYIVAYMTEQLELQPGDKVLEIGTGSGYQAAILAEIVEEVYTIEIIKQLGLRAASTLKNQGYSNVFCRIGDGYHGWKENEPYDAIILTAAPSNVPKALFEQLDEEGQLIAPIEKNGQQYLILYTKEKNKIKHKRLLAVRFVPFTRNNP